MKYENLNKDIVTCVCMFVTEDIKNMRGGNQPPIPEYLTLVQDIGRLDDILWDQRQHYALINKELEEAFNKINETLKLALNTEDFGPYEEAAEELVKLITDHDKGGNN